MCLIVDKNDKCKKADEDIPVYKELILTHFGKLITPYTSMEVPDDGVLVPLEQLSYIPISNAWKFYGYKEISYGAIHCYKPDKASFLFCNNDSIWYKGVIPKGTKYYTSICNREYAAMKVILDLSTPIKDPKLCV